MCSSCFIDSELIKGLGDVELRALSIQYIFGYLGNF